MAPWSGHPVLMKFCNSETVALEAEAIMALVVVKLADILCPC